MTAISHRDEFVFVTIAKMHKMTQCAPFSGMKTVVVRDLESNGEEMLRGWKVEPLRDLIDPMVAIREKPAVDRWPRREKTRAAPICWPCENYQRRRRGHSQRSWDRLVG
jgi:hypothetical protein